jgi:hypothetical protein
VDAAGEIDLGGALKVAYSGSGKLAVGDKFTLFKGGLVNSFTTVDLPSPGSGMTWTNKILIDGSIEVIACDCGEPATPPTIALENSATSFTLSWPPSYTSFVLRGQTNAVTIGLGTNWAPVSGVVGNRITIPRNTANGSVFFQLFKQ